MIKIRYQLLYNKVKETLKREGCSEEQADNVTHSLMMAEACGVPSHGLRMLGDHIAKIKNGFYRLNVNISIEKETPTFTKVNCHGTIGMDSAVRCMQISMHKCRNNGIHMVLANNANTYSAAFVFPFIAAKQGMIGITMSNAPAKMPAFGGKQKLLGTNPISYAIPAKNEDPILFDMATSVVAQSKINMAKEKGKAIPNGWALDAEGRPTTNALEACKGMILPMAGPKGYGLSMMIDVLAGLLSGAAILDEVGRFYNDKNECMNVGQIFVAINPVQIYGKEFYQAVDNYIAKIKSSRPMNNEKVFLPGEHKFNKLNEVMANGVLISDELQNSLELCGINFNSLEL